MIIPLYTGIAYMQHRHLILLPWHIIGDYLTRSVAIAGVLHTMLPPWDWRPEFVEEGLADFPSAQRRFYGLFHNRWYKLIVYVVGYVALHARSTVWRSISVDKQVASGIADDKAANLAGGYSDPHD